MGKMTTKEIVITGLAVALVFTATMIHIRLPIGQGGLIHLAGAFGMGLFDLMGGWTPWAPATFIIVGLMGYAVGVISEKKNDVAGYAMAILAACAMKIVGYYIAEALIYGNWVQPVLSIPGNLIQIGVAAVIVLPIAGMLNQYQHKYTMGVSGTIINMVGV